MKTHQFPKRALTSVCIIAFAVALSAQTQTPTRAPHLTDAGKTALAAQMNDAVKKGDAPAVVEGDSPRLKTALAAVLHGLRREVVSTDRLVVRERAGEYNNKPASWIAIAEAEHIDSVSNAALESLTTFDEWRGGCGLSLAVARRIIDRHAGAVWSLAEGPKTAAVVVLPLKP